ncbi:MAG: glycosyltransferase family 39 protein [Geitlerinemataceae cyanobacterium]
MNYVLLVWLAIGFSLRLLNLESLPPWTDECATLVFSLGNTFRTVPIDRVISTDVLLQPLQPNPQAGIADVFQHLMTESTHPPVYFILAHGWMQLFSPVKGLASIWAARLLPTLLGAASIPAIFYCCWLAFRSRRVAHLAAAMIAVSPFAVYLAQEARHYTLAMLLVIASLSCLVKAVQAISGQGKFPVWVAITWIVVNSLGIAVHYFFALTLCSEFLVLVGFGIAAARSHPEALRKASWTNIYMAIGGTLAGGLVWVPVWQGVYGSNLTDWVADGSPGTFEPLLRLLAWSISILALLPLDPFLFPLWTIGIFGSMTIAFLAWAIPLLFQGLNRQVSHIDRRLPIQVFGGVVLASVVLMLGLTYGVEKDLTLAPRFGFIYFPAAIILIGASLSVFMPPNSEWISQQESLGESPGQELKKVTNTTPIVMILLMATIGSFTVANNWGYLQTHRSDRLANLIYKTSEVPVLIATTHRHHGDTGRMMGLAWEFHQLNSFKPEWTRPPQFLLAHKNDDPETIDNPKTMLKQVVAQSSRPVDVWAVNFNYQIDLAGQKCDRDEDIDVEVSEYRYKLYHCFEK